MIAPVHLSVNRFLQDFLPYEKFLSRCQRKNAAEQAENRPSAALSVMDFSLLSPLEFFADPKNGDGRNNQPPAMRVRVDCYTKKLPFRLQ